jgi:hypothetical protein
MGRHVSTCCTIISKSQRTRLRKATREWMLAPPMGSQHVPGWARGPLSVPWGSGTPAYKLQVKIKGRVAPGPPHVPAAPAPASQLGAALGAPRVPVALAPTSWLRAALGLPRVPVAPASWLRAAPVPPYVTWAPVPAFWLRAALELPRVPWMGSTSCKLLNKYYLVTWPSWSSSGHVRAYLPRHYATRAAPRICKACGRRSIKCWWDVWAGRLQGRASTTDL